MTAEQIVLAAGPAWTRSWAANCRRHLVHAGRTADRPRARAPGAAAEGDAMTIRLCFGIDPGATGAIAALADGDAVAVIDMPMCGQDQSEVDALAIARFMREQDVRALRRPT